MNQTTNSICLFGTKPNLIWSKSECFISNRKWNSWHEYPKQFYFHTCLDTLFYDDSMTILFLVIYFHIISELDFAANKVHDYSLLHTLHYCGLWSWLNYIAKLIIYEVTFYYFTCCHQILSTRFEFSFIKTQ